MATNKAIAKQDCHEQDRLIAVLYQIAREHRALIGTPIPEADRELLASELYQDALPGAFDSGVAAAWILHVVLPGRSADARARDIAHEIVSAETFASSSVTPNDAWTVKTGMKDLNDCVSEEDCGGNCSIVYVLFAEGSWAATKHSGWDAIDGNPCHRSVNALLTLDPMK